MKISIIPFNIDDLKSRTWLGLLCLVFITLSIFKSCSKWWSSNLSITYPFAIIVTKTVTFVVLNLKIKVLIWVLCLKTILLYGMKNDLNYERISIMWISSHISFMLKRKGQSKYQIDSQISTNTSFQNDQSYNICNNFNLCWNHKYVALKTEWRTNKINEIRFDGRNQNTKVNKQTYKFYSFPVGS